MRCRNAAVAAISIALVAVGCASTPANSIDDGAVVEASHPAFAAFVVDDADSLGAWYARVFGVAARNAVDMGARGRILIMDNAAGVTVELIQRTGAVDPVVAINAVDARSSVRGPFKVGVFVDDATAAHAAAVAADLDVDAATFFDEALNRETFIIRDPEGNRVQVFGPNGRR